MNSFKNSAYKILKEVGKPLHSKKITEIAIERGLLKTVGKTPKATMNATILEDINNNNDSRFIKVAPSVFFLKNKGTKFMTRKRKNKSTKGALIKGMSNNLPSEILTDPVFKNKLQEIMKGYAGIYALYKGEGLYYIGLTKNLHGRINWHLKDRHAKKWDYFKIFRIHRVKFLKDIETLVQHIVIPKGNRAKGKVPKDSDLSYVLREVLRENEKRTKLLKKALR